MKNFGDLIRGEQLALFEAWLDGELIEMKTSTEEWCENPYPSWVTGLAYRLKPKTPSINWDHVNPDYNWLATDKDGRSFLYIGRPADEDNSWCTPGSEYGRADAIVSFKPGTCPWRESLVRRPS